MTWLWKDYAFETQNEKVINLVEKLIGNEFVSEFPNIIQEQENQIKGNQETLIENINKLKEIDHAIRVSNLAEQSEGGGGLLPTTIMMLADEPNPFDINSITRRYDQEPNYSLSRRTVQSGNIYLFLF